MRHTFWVSLLLTSGMLLSGALIAAPDANELLNVLRTSHFTPLTHVTDLPLPVLRACVNDPDDVAEPGGPFNPTDVILPGDTKRRTRLVWAAAATDGEHYVAEFEYGGMGYHRTILLVAFDNSRPTARVLGIADDENDAARISNIADLIKTAATSKEPFWRELGRYH
jgi:hypothetical protein